MAAGHLPRPGLDVDVATDSVQEQSQRVLERLPRVLVEQLGLLAGVVLPAQQGLLQSPAPLIDFAVESNDKMAIDILRRLSRDSMRDQAVRDRAAQALERLLKGGQA